MNPAPFIPEAASTFAVQYDYLFWFFMLVAGAAGVVTFAVGAYFVVRYRRGTGRYVKPNGHDHTWIEVAWSMPVLFVVAILFVWGARLYVDAYTYPEDATEIFVTGKQWMWKVQHPNGKREINELHLPVDTPIKLTMTSEDVIHSFYIPAFRTKRDVLPGRYTQLWFEPTKEGEYHLFCAEYCGTEHSRMVGKIYVMRQDDYQEWIAGSEVIVSMKDKGRELFEKNACNSCHEGEAAAAPSLAGTFGSPRTLADGQTVYADETYIRESILTPNAKLVRGFGAVMPTYKGQIDEDGLNQLVAYIKSLKADRKDQAMLTEADRRQEENR